MKTRSETLGWKHGGYNTALSFWRSRSGNFDLEIADLETLARDIRREYAQDGRSTADGGAQ